MVLSLLRIHKTDVGIWSDNSQLSLRYILGLGFWKTNAFVDLVGSDALVVICVVDACAIRHHEVEIGNVSVVLKV